MSLKFEYSTFSETLVEKLLIKKHNTNTEYIYELAIKIKHNM